MADSVTVVVPLETVYPACPMWMNTLHNFAVKYGLERIQKQLEDMAAARGCILEEAQT